MQFIHMASLVQQPPVPYKNLHLLTPKTFAQDLASKSVIFLVVIKGVNTSVAQILKRVGPNAYVTDLPPKYEISSTFSVEDLMASKDPMTIPLDPFISPSPLPI
ncbi:hypothetical protein U1Q18_052667 [Sarracenia purpurea var. burkii]